MWLTKPHIDGRVPFLTPTFVRAIRFSLEVLFIFTAILILLAYRCALTGNRVKTWAFSEAYPVRKSFDLAGCTMLGELHEEPATSQYDPLVWFDTTPYRGEY